MSCSQVLGIITIHTQVCDELLSRVHILEQLLEELVSEPLLHGGGILLQVLQTSASNSRHLLLINI